jgi:hypothetical protein
MATESEIRKKVEEIVSRTMEKSTDAVRNELATLEKTIKVCRDS